MPRLPALTLENCSAMSPSTTSSLNEPEVRSTHARHIRRNERLGYATSESDDVASFGELYRQTMVRTEATQRYFLGGTADGLLEHSPFKSTVQAMIDLAGELKMPLNLGGGLRPGDALEHFKRGFANSTAPFYTHQLVCDPAAYEWLSAGRDPSSGFFPLYRADVQSG